MTFQLVWSQNLSHTLHIFDHLVYELFSYDFSNFLCSQMLLYIYDIHFHTHLIHDFSTGLWCQNLNHKSYIFDYLVYVQGQPFKEPEQAPDIQDVKFFGLLNSELLPKIKDFIKQVNTL